MFITDGENFKRSISRACNTKGMLYKKRLVELINNNELFDLSTNLKVEITCKIENRYFTLSRQFYCIHSNKGQFCQIRIEAQLLRRKIIKFDLHKYQVSTAWACQKNTNQKKGARKWVSCTGHRTVFRCLILVD